MSSQREQEQFIANYPKRLRYSPEKLQVHLADLIPSELVKRVRGEFYNSLVMEMATCVLYSIFVNSSSQVPVDERIKYWFRDLEQIGDESVEGYAMRSDLGETENTFILKAPRDPNNSDILHELFIGLYGTNRLRSLLPNFAYIFGGFPCSPPIIQSRNEVVEGRVIRRDEAQVVSYCQRGNQNKVPYVIYENIAPATSLGEYVQTCSGEEFFLVFRQLLNALRQAWLTIRFVHNDLHTGNVLIRQLDDFYSFPYSTAQGVEYITTNQLATVIDVGRSHIMYHDKHYGFSGLEDVGVFENIPLPITDVYKALFFSLYDMYYSNNVETFYQAKQLAAYFFPDLLSLDDPSFDRKLIHLLEQERNNVYYYLNFKQGEKQRFYRAAMNYQKTGRIDGQLPTTWIRAITFNYDDFIAYVNRFCQCSAITSKPLSRLAYCRRDRCGNSREILNSFFERPIDQNPTAEDFYEFYDLHTNRLLTKDLKSSLVSDFKRIYPRSKDEYLLDLISDLNDLNDHLNNIDEMTLTGKSINEIALIADAYRERFTLIAEAVTIWKEIPFQAKVGEYIATLYSDRDLTNKIREQLNRTQVMSHKLNSYLEGLVADRDYLKRRNFWHHDLNWLLQSFPQALDILLK